METTDTEFIHPEDMNNFKYWRKKFGVTQRQLNDAILYTGSLEVKKVKEYLKRDSWVYHPVERTARLMKSTLNLIF